MGAYARPMRGLVIAALAWLGSGQALANQACELRLRANLPIAELGDPPAVVVAARYEDTLLRMIFDTGASTTVLEGSVPGFAGLRRLTTGVANGAGGDVAVWHARNLSLGLGGLTLSLPYVAVTDPRNPLYGNRFDGLLGIDALRDYDFEFDPEAGRIRLFSQQHCAGKVVYWANEYSEIPFRRGVDRRIDVAVRIDGRALRGIIDTGSSHTVMSWPDAEDVFGLTTDSPDIQAADGRTLTSDGKLVDASRKTFQSLDLGALRVRNVSVNLLPHSASGSLPRPFEVDEASPQIVIGMDLLQHLRFYVANAEEMIYFTLVQPPA